jgi:hypothetical protein
MVCAPLGEDINMLVSGPHNPFSGVMKKLQASGLAVYRGVSAYSDLTL